MIWSFLPHDAFFLHAVGTVEFRSLLEPIRISNPFVTYIEAECEVRYSLEKAPAPSLEHSRGFIVKIVSICTGTGCQPQAGILYIDIRIRKRPEAAV